jgi:uncharacterized protein (TIGR01777 family)
MNILMTGGTGMIGAPLCDKLTAEGHELVVLTRRSLASNGAVRYISDLGELNLDEGFDAVINFAGEPIADKPWSDKRKKLIYDSRLGITAQLVDHIAAMDEKPAVFISGSAVGFYGAGVSDDTVTESASGTESFSYELCRDWEQEALRAEALGPRTCLLRTGIVMGDGGALGKMLLPFKLGLGGKIGSGEQWMPWIHILDMINIISFILNNDSMSGPVNCTAPKPVRNAEFSKQLGGALGRPTFLPMPAFAVRLLMGEMGEELLLGGKRVVPAKLLDAGFEFEFDEVSSALKSVVAS